MTRDRNRIDWTRIPDIPMNAGERTEDLVTVWLTYDDGPRVGSRFSAAGRWRLKREGVAALPLGNGLYAIRSVPPALANWGDTVRCLSGPAGQLVVDEIVEQSDHRTYRAVAEDRENPLLRDVKEAIRRDGGRLFNAAGRLWLVDVPPSASHAKIEQVLDAAEASGLVRYENTLDGTALAGAWWSEGASERGFSRRLWHYRIVPYLPVLALAVAFAIGEGVFGLWIYALAAVIGLPLIAIVVIRRRRSLRAARS